jgi:hypothetical protein
MKRLPQVIAYRILAAALLGAGAFLIVAAWLQVINPGLAAFDEPHGLVWYTVGTFLAIVLLGLAWCFNLKALRLHGDIP